MCSLHRESMDRVGTPRGLSRSLSILVKEGKLRTEIACWRWRRGEMEAWSFLLPDRGRWEKDQNSSEDGIFRVAGRELSHQLLPCF